MFIANSPKVHKALIPLSMIFLAAALFLLVRLHPTANLGQDRIDGICGFLFGISIGLGLLYVKLGIRLHRNGEN